MNPNANFGGMNSGMNRGNIGSAGFGGGNRANVGFSSSARSPMMRHNHHHHRHNHFGNRSVIHHHDNLAAGVAVTAGLGAFVAGAMIADAMSTPDPIVVTGASGYPGAQRTVVMQQPPPQLQQQVVYQQPVMHAPPPLNRPMAPGQQQQVPQSVAQYQGFIPQSQATASPPDLAEGRPWPPTWERDDRAPRCRLCVKPFSLFVRRHHCRLCNRVVCDDCSTRRVDGRRFPPLRPVMDNRACDVCFDLATLVEGQPQAQPPSRRFADGVDVSPAGLTIPKAALLPDPQTGLVPGGAAAGDTPLTIGFQEILSMNGTQLLESRCIVNLYDQNLYPGLRQPQLVFVTEFASAVHNLVTAHVRHMRASTSQPTSKPNNQNNNNNTSMSVAPPLDDECNNNNDFSIAPAPPSGPVVYNADMMNNISYSGMK